MVATSAERVKEVIGADKPATRTSSVSRVAVIAIAVAGVVGLAALVAVRSSHPPQPGYEFAAARRGDLRVTVTATGVLEATTTVEVGAEVTGRLLTVLVANNAKVQKGQLLATIDPEQLRAAAEEAEAQVASASAAIRLARATLLETEQAAARSKDQTRMGLISQRDLEASLAAEARARANVESATASATLARATLNQARSRLDKTKIVSPIDGIVLSRRVEPGQTLTAGFQTPLLFRIAQDLTKMRLNIAVDEADIGRVREGQEATFKVKAYPDRKFSSHVLSLQNEAKTTQNVVTYQVVLSVDNEEGLLRPGMTSIATVLADMRQNVLLVPNAALRFMPPVTESQPAPVLDLSKGQRQLWILQGERPSAVTVQAGATDGSLTEIVSDQITAGKNVIIDVKEAE